jgi:hypothetical protein
MPTVVGFKAYQLEGASYWKEMWGRRQLTGEMDEEAM